MKKRRKGRIRDFERERDGKSLEEYRRERHQHVQGTAVQAAPKKKKVRINKGRIALTVIVLVLIAVVGVSIKNVFDLRAEQQELAATQKVLAKEKAALEEELKNVNDLEYIEEQARIQLRLIKPGEILYILDDEDEEQNHDEDQDENENQSDDQGQEDND